MKKSLVVNTQKSQVMCFNSRSTNLPSFFYDGSPLPYTHHFKYLGMMFDKNLNLSAAADAALQPFMKDLQNSTLCSGAQSNQPTSYPDLVT
eukprot:103638-Pelagomonas_calceolata.AAC.1